MSIQDTPDTVVNPLRKLISMFTRESKRPIMEGHPDWDDLILPALEELVRESGENLASGYVLALFTDSTSPLITAGDLLCQYALGIAEATYMLAYNRGRKETLISVQATESHKEG